MAYNLTGMQKDLATWLVRERRSGLLPEEFFVTWVFAGPVITHYQGELPKFTRATLEALMDEGLLAVERYTHGVNCILRGDIFTAVDSDFGAPDMSYARFVTPLEGIQHLDNDIRERCLRLLEAGGADPKLWDNAVRTAGVILEERLRDVSGLHDRKLRPQDVVNRALGQKGVLAAKFAAHCASFT